MSFFKLNHRMCPKMRIIYNYIQNLRKCHRAVFHKLGFCANEYFSFSVIRFVDLYLFFLFRNCCLHCDFLGLIFLDSKYLYKNTATFIAFLALSKLQGVPLFLPDQLSKLYMSRRRSTIVNKCILEI